MITPYTEKSRKKKSSARPTPFPENMNALPLMLKQFKRKYQGKVDLAACILPITVEFQEWLEQTCMFKGI